LSLSPRLPCDANVTEPQTSPQLPPSQEGSPQSFPSPPSVPDIPPTFEWFQTVRCPPPSPQQLVLIHPPIGQFSIFVFPSFRFSFDPGFVFATWLRVDSLFPAGSGEQILFLFRSLPVSKSFFAQRLTLPERLLRIFFPCLFFHFPFTYFLLCVCIVKQPTSFSGALSLFSPPSSISLNNPQRMVGPSLFRSPTLFWLPRYP